MPGRLITTTLVLSLLLGVSFPLLGATPQFKNQTVLVLPIRELAHSCDELFSPHPPASGNAVQLGRILQQQVAQTQYTKTISYSEFRSDLAGSASYKEKLVLGRERYLLAKELYRELRQTEAEDNLLRSIRFLQQIFYELVEPEAFAEIYLLLGVTRMELGRNAEAHLAFKKAMFLNPRLPIQRGYYPEPVEQALTIACEDSRRSVGTISYEDVDRALHFMKSWKIDAIVISILSQQGGKTALFLGVLDQKSRSVVFRETIPLAGSMEVDEAQISRAVGRWNACTARQSIQPRLEERHRYVFSAAYQQMAYLSYPTRSILNTTGFSFESGFFLLRNFALVAKAQFTSSLPDRFGDMLSPLTSFRLILGPAFSVSGNWWRLYVVPGAEVHMLGAFSTSSDPDCKFYNKDSDGFAAMCPDGQIKKYPVTFLGGVNVSLGAQFFFSNRLFLSTALSISTYFMPFDRSIEMNFPVAIEAGGGIAF